MKIVDNDNWLTPVAEEVQKRYDRYCNRLETIEKRYGSLSTFASAYEFFGFYKNLLNFRESHPAIHQGAFYDLMWANPWYNNFDPQYVYAFLRYYGNDKLLIVINFNLHEGRNVTVTIPDDARKLIGGCNEKYNVELKPGDYKIIQL